MKGKLKIGKVSMILTGVAAVLSIVTAVLGSTQNALVQNTSFSLPLILSLAAAVVLIVVSFFVSFDVLPLLISAVLSLAFGLLVKGGAEVVNDHNLNIQFSGGNFSQVLVYLILLGLAVVLAIVNCFVARTPDREAGSVKVVAEDPEGPAAKE